MTIDQDRLTTNPEYKIDTEEYVPPEHEKSDQYRTERIGHNVEWTDGRNRCKVTDLPIWTDEYRLKYLENFGIRVLKEKRGFLTIEIDMRLLKLFNDHYSETTANKALRQFTRELLAKLEEWTSDDPNAEYHLYKVRDGGDDYSLAVSGSDIVLNRIVQEIAGFLDHQISDFTNYNKSNQLETRKLGAECGISQLHEGEDVFTTTPQIQETYQFPSDRIRDVNRISGLDLWHDITETHRHAATSELVKSKFLQIFSELEEGDNVVRSAIEPARSEILPLYPQEFHYQLLDTMAPDIETLDNERLDARMQELSALLFFSPFDRIRPLTQEGAVTPHTAELALEDAAIFKSEIKQGFMDKVTPAFKELPKIFGERRKSPAGELYTITLVRICQELITRVDTEAPLPPKLLAFMNIISYKTAEAVSQYVADLVKRKITLNRTQQEIDNRERGMPVLERKPLPYAYQRLLSFSRF